MCKTFRPRVIYFLFVSKESDIVVKWSRLVFFQVFWRSGWGRTFNRAWTLSAVSCTDLSMMAAPLVLVTLQTGFISLLPLFLFSSSWRLLSRTSLLSASSVARQGTVSPINELLRMTDSGVVWGLSLGFSNKRKLKRHCVWLLQMAACERKPDMDNLFKTRSFLLPPVSVHFSTVLFVLLPFRMFPPSSWPRQCPCPWRWGATGSWAPAQSTPWPFRPPPSSPTGTTPSPSGARSSSSALLVCNRVQ